MSLSVTIQSASANVNRPAATDKVLFCIAIPNELLYRWYSAKKTTAASASPNTIVSQLNKEIKGIQLSESLEVALYSKGARLCMSVKDKGKRKKVLSKSSIIDVFTENVIDPDESLRVLR